MQTSRLKYKVALLLISLGSIVIAQDPGDITNLIREEIEIWNPVYKPVVGVGVGSYNFFGDVQTPNQTAFNGDPGFKVNVSTFLDNKHNVRGNFYLMGGNFSGNQRSYSDTTLNHNFKSSVYIFGFNANYDFDHIFSAKTKLHPFISIGAEIVTFDSKTDLTTEVEGATVTYSYWPDGSIRDGYQTNVSANPIRRDYIYESSVKDIPYDFEIKKYPQYAFAIPLEVGLDYQVTDRIMFRVGTSLHYMFSDDIDHVSYNSSNGKIGDAMNDMFTFSYFSIHLDLFSSDKIIMVEKMFADLEFDNTLMGDEDGDGWFDGYDNCPFTPFGVETDTAGCPIDSDLDRIPDYLDDEPNSRYGAYVDERGVEISEDDVIATLDMSKAVPRSDIAMYIRTPSSYSNYRKISSKEIPVKYKKVDDDTDGYISFDEMMDAIDGFFDFDSELSTDDIFELNDFFFSQ